MPRHTAAALAVILVCSVLVPFAAVPVAADVPDARLAITDATVSPAAPSAGAPVTVSATVRLSGGSFSAATLDSVALRDSEGDTVGETTDVGSLSAGETLTVPVSATFDRPGERELMIVATVSDANGNETVARRSLALAVEGGAPLLSHNASTPVLGTDTTLGIGVSNPTAGPLRNLTVSVESPADGERVRRTIAALDAGESAQRNFSVRPAETGERPLRVRVDYTTAAGTRASMTETWTLDVAELEDDVGVRVARGGTDAGGEEEDGGVGGLGGLGGIFGGGGGSGALQSSDDGDSGTSADATVTNFGNAAIEDVVLVPRGPNGTVVPEIGRVAVADRLAPGAAASVNVDLSGVERAGAVSFVAAYDLAGERREAGTNFDFRPPRGAVELTGLNVTVGENGAVRVGGNLGNVGGGEVTGAVVRVGSSEYVSPGYTGRSYFVGTVGASEFAPFELRARADLANATTVPVEVTYTAGDERVTETVPVPLITEATDDDPGGVIDFGALGGALLAIGVAAFVGVAAFFRGR